MEAAGIWDIRVALCERHLGTPNGNCLLVGMEDGHVNGSEHCNVFGKLAL